MQIITTEDGSDTLFSDEFNEMYHSTHGAVRESRHVYIQNGLDYAINNQQVTSEPIDLFHNSPIPSPSERVLWGEDNKKTNYERGLIRIFEMGFSTGLNALLTMLEGEKRKINLYYETIELYPVAIETIKALNYTNFLGYEHCYGPYHTMHLCRWNEAHPLTKDFTFKKVVGSITEIELTEHNFHVIYFDAFAPEIQPELWSAEIMKKMYGLLASGGVLVSYCSKVSFQKALKEAGFVIDKIPGPPGKREMIRAIKK